MQTLIARTDKQQGPTTQHGNYVQYPVINHNGKEYEKEHIYNIYTDTYAYEFEAFCPIVEINTMLYINYASIKVRMN